MVIIAGQNYGSILTMARDLGEAGYAVCVIRVFKKAPGRLNILGGMTPERESRYVTDYKQVVLNGDPGAFLSCLEALADPSRKQVLLCVDDFLVAIVDDNYDRLAPFFHLSNINEEAGAVTRLMDKDKQKQLAARCGLPVLRSTIATTNADGVMIPGDTPYPCFVKPLISMQGAKKTMARCDSEAELEGLLQQLSGGKEGRFLAEQYINLKDEYAALGISLPGLVWIPGAFRYIRSGHRERTGVAVTGRIETHPALPEVLNACKEFVTALQYHGIFDIDLLESEEGNLYFIEINFRSGASTHVFSAAGANLPAAFADYATKGTLPDMTKYEANRTAVFVSEKALLEEYVHSDVSGKEIAQAQAEANVPFIRDTADPAPYVYFQKYMKRAKWLRLPYKVLDRLRQKR